MHHRGRAAVELGRFAAGGEGVAGPVTRNQEAKPQRSGPQGRDLCIFMACLRVATHAKRPNSTSALDRIRDIDELVRHTELAGQQLTQSLDPQLLGCVMPGRVEMHAQLLGG